MGQHRTTDERGSSVLCCDQTPTGTTSDASVARRSFVPNKCLAKRELTANPFPFRRSGRYVEQLFPRIVH